MIVSVFKNINHFAGKWENLDKLAVFCARFLPYFMVIFLLIFCIWQKNIYIFIYVIASGIIARAVNELVHIFYKEIRPGNLFGTKTLIPLPKSYSFPSGHASFFFGISFLLFFYYEILGAIFVAMSLVIGLARVFCGAHWFRDIIGGIIVGLLVATTINNLLIPWI